MPDTTAAALKKLLRSVASTADVTASDRDLLLRFAREGDQAAFAALVRRHVPMVLGVCQRALANAADAEDASQATFLLLAQKAKEGGRWQSSIANWLYATARKVAANARVAARRRVRREAHASVREAVEPVDVAVRELLAALDEELDKLPPRYREPLVLCYLEGLTRDEAAHRLGVPLNTVKIRLERGRKKLHAAMTSRGLGLGASLLALAATSRAGASPLRLAESILATVSGRIPATVAAFAEGVSMSGLLKKVILAVLVAGTLGVGLGAAWLVPGGQQSNRLPLAPLAPATTEAKPVATDASGDPLPDGAVALIGSSRLRHGGGIFFAAYTPDGKRLLTAGADETIRLWDLSTGKELRRFRCGMTAETAVALSPDGKVIATVSPDWKGTLTLWDAATGKRLHQAATGQMSLQRGCLVFAADSKTLLTVDLDQSALVWDVASGKNVKRLREANPQRGLIRVAVSPDWKYLAWLRYDNAGGASVKVMDLATNRELPEIKVKANRYFALLTFSSDSKVLAWSRLEGVVLWDVAANKVRRQLPARTGTPNAIALSADGNLVAVSHADTVAIWDDRTGKQVASAGKPIIYQLYLESPLRQRHAALAFSPDGKKLVASCGGPSVLQLDAATGKQAAEPGGHRAAVSLLGLSSAGKAVATYSRGDPVRFWDLATGKEVRQAAIPENATCAACSADGQRIAAAVENTVTVYDAAGKLLKRFEVGKSGLFRGDRIVALAFSPDSRVLAVRRGIVPEVRLWDTTTGKQLVTLARTQGTEAPTTLGLDNGKAWGMMTLDLAFTPDGRYLAGAGAKRQLILWDGRTGEPVWTMSLGDTQAVERFALSPTGHMLATLNSDGTLTLYETAMAQQRIRLGKPHEKRGGNRVSHIYAGLSIPLRKPDEPLALAFSPDGRYLATADGAPVIHLWDLIAGQEVGRLKGQQGGVVSLMFTPDGRRLLSGSVDTTALTWDLGRILKKAAPGGKLDAKALDGLWKDLSGTDAARAFAALRKLAASPEQAAALVKERLSRPAAPADPKRLAALLADLQSDRFTVRHKAEVELEALGKQAEAELRKALSGDPGLDLRMRLKRLLQRLPYAGLVDLRAVELLELVGGTEARHVLDELSRGAPGARLTREATAAAQRLAKRR